MGSLQALEAIKVLTGVGRPLTDAILLWEGGTQQWEWCASPATRTAPSAEAAETAVRAAFGPATQGGLWRGLQLAARNAISRS